MELSFGEKVRAFREDMDINQTQLGSALNMSQRKISYIECGKCEPSVQDIKAICRYFNVSADYLLGLKKGLDYPER
ncbi:MAG: helix-turn-helix transcriptional regulator [Oscillospiraceae bacterium]|nr:helix-turn-helix transcriptional regulator [Oscillospiraceae bacterium]MBQ3500175.1 helix-turn-helix transcriptional regulator [Oscillospiraceae bacterium]MBQ4547408.1 helix-turn-helix transcriptional regulator [Oscillospiraceae bacterium]MBQ4643646.1 helix-turn-helix transcriptional regulator [Oscillospiraceae bacterium]